MSTDHQQAHHHHHQEEEPGVGLIASGLAWVDKQREKRRREQLKMEAEKQLQKIAHAERARKEASAATCDSAGGARSYSFDTSTSDVLSSSGSVDLDGEAGNQNLNDLTVGGTSDVSKSGGVRVNLSDALIDVDNEGEPCEEIIPPVRVTQVKGDESSPYVLNAEQMHAIAKYVLPETIMFCRWRRLYGLGRDGDSFDGCIRIIGASKRTLMVVKTTRGEIFGGYADEPWHSRDQNSTAKFYGSASSALFSFSSSSLSTSTTTSSSTSIKDGNKNSTLSSTSSSPIPIEVYRWTGKNRYIQVCDVSTKMLAFGGGGDEGTFGLCLQEDFQRGTTGHCDTFDNEPLCEEGNFDVVDVEFWEFLTGVF